MKKIFVLLLAVVMVLALAACGGNGGGAEPPQVDTPTPTPVTPTPPQEETPQNGANRESVAVGNIIQFGGYDWRVLDVQDDRALIVTEDIIAIWEHYTWEAVTWAERETRQYLNGEFLDSFNAADRERIAETNVVNNDNPWFGTTGGANTTDRIFLLSLEEVVRYFGDSGQLQNRPGNAVWLSDNYNEARIARFGADVDLTASGLDVGSAWVWLLRSPGSESHRAAFILPDGGINVYGYYGGGGVRPALWLYLDGSGTTPPANNQTPTEAPAGGNGTTPANIPEYITIGGREISISETSLRLSGLNLTNEDIEPLRYMVNLTMLWLDDNRISDLAPLAGLTNLTTLGLENNQINDLTPLAGLSNLTALGARNNQISDLTPLAGLTNLTILGLAENQISDLTPLAELTNLAIASLHGNQITDWSPVAHVRDVH